MMIFVHFFWRISVSIDKNEKLIEINQSINQTQCALVSRNFFFFAMNKLIDDDDRNFIFI